MILKPCPFCGGEGVVIIRECEYPVNPKIRPSYGVECKSCKAKTDPWYTCEENAVNAWNRRIVDGKN